MQRHRFVEAQVTAARSTVAFPGSVMPEPAGARQRWVSSAASILLHGGFLLLFFLLAQMAKEELVEETIEISLPKQAQDEPAAPRPRAIAESMRTFSPQAMALPPQVVNPTVIQQRIPDVQAAQVQVAQIQPVQAPKNVAQIQAPEVPTLRNFQSPIVGSTVAPKIVDAGATQLSGPVDYQAPTGTTSGPRQVVVGGNTVGIADPKALGSGSAVAEGIGSDRDVFGGKTGERASVNTAVGPDGGRGTGGDGIGAGGVPFNECMDRPEVKAYLERLKQRVDGRWRNMPSSLPDGTYKVTLGFSLDTSGSANDVRMVSAANPAVGQSAAEAMRASSPFDQMPDRVRCIAGNRFNLIFTLENLAQN
jgi:hypothetical protein